MSHISRNSALGVATSRRAILRKSRLGLARLVAALGTAQQSPAQAHQDVSGALTDTDILNFALNFEYLGAEFYLAALGHQPLSTTLTKGGDGSPGGGTALPSITRVPFDNEAIFSFAEQLAIDEYAHVSVLRTVLGGKVIAAPAIDLYNSWTNLAVAAGLIAPGQQFNPFASESDFLLGAYVLEDLCVTALCGAASLLSSKTNLAYIASILGVEAYQAGMIRQRLSAIGGGAATNAISNLRSTLANQVIASGVDDYGTDAEGDAFNVTNTDVNGQAFRRSFAQILAVAYGTTTQPNSGVGATGGGLFPNGVNGRIFATG